MTPTSITITITAEDWRAGECLDPLRCAVAQAAMRDLQLNEGAVAVDQFTLDVLAGPQGGTYRVAGPLRTLIRAFDHGLEAGVLPQTFTLERVSR